MSRPVTLTDQVASHLREAVHAERYKPGKRLPSEAELMKEFGVSRNTVRVALGRLINEGLIESRPRQGTFVRTRQPRIFRPQDEFTPRPANPPKDAFLTELESQGRDPEQLIEVHIVQSPDVVSTRLELDGGALTAVRRKVRKLDGEPYEISDAYFPLTLVEGTEIMHPGDISRGAGRILAERGHLQMRFRDEITSRMPHPDETDRLELGPGTPVTVHMRTGYDSDGTPVRVLMTVLPSDKHVILYNLTRPAEAAT